MVSAAKGPAIQIGAVRAQNSRGGMRRVEKTTSSRARATPAETGSSETMTATLRMSAAAMRATGLVRSTGERMVGVPVM